MNQNEKDKYNRIKIDPLSGISVDGFRYTETKPADIEKFSPKLNNPFFVGDSQLARDLQKVISDAERFAEEFHPLSFSQQDSSREGTRSIKGVLKSYPDKIIVLSGLGVVRFVGVPPTGFIVEPPHWSETVDKYIEMGHMQISQEGQVWSHANRTVFGAYDSDELSTKLDHTRRYSSAMNQDHDLEVLLAGEHRQSSKHGWMAYALPANAVRTTELQAIDLMRRTDVEDPGMYGQYVSLLFRRVKGMHQKRVVHLELHPGNCYPVLETDGSVDLVITDWTTAQSLSDLPSDTTLSSEGYRRNGTSWGELSADRTAMATDIFVALENVLLLSNGHIDKSQEHRKDFGVDVTSFAITKDMVELQLTYFAQAITAYLESEMDTTQVREIVKRLLNEKSIPEILGKIDLIKSDWDYAGGDIDKMDRPNYLMRGAFSVLAKMVAIFLASGQTIMTYESVAGIADSAVEVEEAEENESRLPS